MTEYKPGTVAEIGWDMTSGRERAIFDGDRWSTESGCTVHKLNVTDIRPLVVLDPEKTGVSEIKIGDAKGVRRYAQYVQDLGNGGAARLLRHIADQVEAQTKPARIPEPGDWAVVEAAREGGDGELRRWVRHAATGTWFCAAEKGAYFWSDLIDPVLIREGVGE